VGPSRKKEPIFGNFSDNLVFFPVRKRSDESALIDEFNHLAKRWRK
jgi:hypothetical protein